MKPRTTAMVSVDGGAWPTGDGKRQMGYTNHLVVSHNAYQVTVGAKPDVSRSKSAQYKLIGSNCSINIGIKSKRMTGIYTHVNSYKNFNIISV